MISSNLHIRRASHADAAVLAALAERTFRAAFGTANTDADMEAYVQEAFSIEQVTLELSKDNHIFLLMFLDDSDSPQGYAKLRTASVHPQVDGSAPVELQRLYVEPGTIGRGIGGKLMRACLETAAETGQTIWLGVWEENLRAIEFYRRWGFETVGSHVFRLGSDEQTDLIMQRSIVGPR